MTREAFNFPLWRRWIIFCAAGELLGIGVAGAIAFAVNHIVGEPETTGAKFIVLLCMLGAGAIEGSLLGSFQWHVLKDQFTTLPKSEWLWYTVSVAVLGWFLGMLPPLFFTSGQEITGADTPGGEMATPVVAALILGSGLILGALFGLFQWFSLRKYAHKASRWILANALGWGLGLGWIYLFASLPSADSPLIFNIAMGISGGLLAGLTVGAVTGFVLVQLDIRQVRFS